MGYLGDWMEAELHAAAVRAKFPDCTQRFDCPADDHIIGCVKAHHEYIKEFNPMLARRLAELHKEDCPCLLHH